MRISGRETVTYLFINGLKVGAPISLGEHVELLPATCAPIPDDVVAVTKSETDLGVATIFLRHMGSQLRITAADPRQLGTRAWNSVWYATLLSAFLQCEAVCNFQCNTPAEQFGSTSRLEVTNYHLRGLGAPEHTFTADDAAWVKRHIASAWRMLELPPFRDAVHALASFRWHSLPRARLALLWAGIEGLFHVESEIVFRVSLYTARFLYPDDEASQKAAFAQVKRLYKQRSAAVHGGTVKGNAQQAVDESAMLLLSLLQRTVATGALPELETLAP